MVTVSGFQYVSVSKRALSKPLVKSYNMANTKASFFIQIINILVLRRAKHIKLFTFVIG